MAEVAITSAVMAKSRAMQGVMQVSFHQGLAKAKREPR
jgi:hypothetical protein